MMRAVLLLTLAAPVDADERIYRFLDATLELPPPERPPPKVKVRIEPAPARPHGTKASKVKP
jgi:hypothetical protein